MYFLDISSVDEIGHSMKNPVARVNGLECGADVGDAEGDNAGEDRNP